ncbi:MAG: hypothetical protein H0W70_07805 [Actinobacteria bacterium]|nr:hypothetical protein [Actinomycetota bacterium]
MAEHPATDPVKLLAQWMEWEKGNVNPGDLVKGLKRGGMREFLEAACMAPERQDAAGSPADTASA